MKHPRYQLVAVDDLGNRYNVFTASTSHKDEPLEMYINWWSNRFTDKTPVLTPVPPVCNHRLIMSRDAKCLKAWTCYPFIILVWLEPRHIIGFEYWVRTSGFSVLDIDIPFQGKVTV